MSDLIKKLSEQTEMDEEEIRSMIREKQSGLTISEEGAAYLIAKELGVNLVKKPERLKIENIIPGMQNVDITGRITNIYPVREFSTEKASGKVMNFEISDGTGIVRVCLWNDEIEGAEGLAEGDTVRIRGYIKEGLRGLEIRLGRGGAINKSDEEFPSIEMKPKSLERTYISELSVGFKREIRATLVQTFETNPFFTLCSQCNARLKEDKCPEHGEVEPKYGLIVTGIIDDGSENIRMVVFGENAEKILNMKIDEARKKFMMKMDKAAIFSKVCLGKEYIFEGNVRRNDFFDRLEFSITGIRDVNVIEEIERILEGEENA